MPNQYPFSLSDLNNELEGEFEPGEELGEGDFEELKANPPKRPSFPVLTFCFALFIDFAFIISLFVSLGILGSIINIIAWIVIRLYLFRKVGFIKRWLYRRFIFTLIVKFIPIINGVPQWTIFVLRARAMEHKKIDKILTAIEKLIIRSATGGGLKSKALERFI